MKKKKSQLILQKYKERERERKRVHAHERETTMNNYMATNLTPRRKGQLFRNTEPTKTESRRN